MADTLTDNDKRIWAAIDEIVETVELEEKDEEDNYSHHGRVHTVAMLMHALGLDATDVGFVACCSFDIQMALEESEPACPDCSGETSDNVLDAAEIAE